LKLILLDCIAVVFRRLGDHSSIKREERSNGTHIAPQSFGHQRLDQRPLFAHPTGTAVLAHGDVFAKLGAAYGLGAGVELEVNLAHMSVGLFNLTAGWHFVHTRYLDLGASLGAWYGHGDWFWIATDAVQKIAANFDVVSIPVTLTASSQPTRWLELDLGAQYQYANIFGSTGDNVSVFTDAQLAVLQLSFRPGVRFFVSDNTALEAFAKLPAFTTIPRDAGDKKVPFSDAWSTEFGVRSRLARGLFGNMRLHYGQPVGLLYGGAKFYPAFDLELRL